MARINVEQIALTDSRFAHLGLLITNPETQSVLEIPFPALGIGVMVYVWNECQERETYDLSNVALDMIGAAFGMVRVSLAKAIVQAGLGERGRNGVTRIKGAQGRTEWLGELRRANRDRQRRFREKARDTNNPSRVTNAPVTVNITGAPAPAPALTTTTKTNTSRGPRTTAPLSGAFAAFWDAYPRRNGQKVGKAKAQAAWKAQGLDTRSDEILTALDLQAKHRADCEARGSFVPEPQDAHRWLRDKRWEDEIGLTETPAIRPEVEFANRRLTPEEKAAMRAKRGA